MIEETIRIFHSMGFTVADGPDIKTAYRSFDALNTPPDHPSRDPGDTFYLESGDLLRTQTSTVQIAPAGASTAALAVPRGGVPGGPDPAIAELRLRYARGDVSRDDFQRTLDDLNGAGTAWPGEETAPTES